MGTCSKWRYAIPKTFGQRQPRFGEQIAGGWNVAGMVALMRPEVQAALLGAGATLVAALIGVAAIVLQIGRQARAAIEQQRISEAIKLKLGLYEEIVRTCESVIDAEVEFSGYVRNFVSQIDGVAALQGAGQPYAIPVGRVPELIRLQGRAHRTAIKIVTTVEQWRIIDPRMVIFQTALNVALYDLMDAYTGFFTIGMRLFPMEGPQPGTLLPWQIPSPPARMAAAAAAEHLFDAAGLLGCVVGDFRDAMQLALLGELFPNPVAPRVPLDPKYVVVTLDRHQELSEYFEKQTAWGRSVAEADAQVRSDLAVRQVITP